MGRRGCAVHRVIVAESSNSKSVVIPETELLFSAVCLPGWTRYAPYQPHEAAVVQQGMAVNCRHCIAYAVLPF